MKIKTGNNWVMLKQGARFTWSFRNEAKGVIEDR